MVENRMVRVSGKSLGLASELLEHFKGKGYRSTMTSVVDTAVPILHAVTLGRYTMVSDAELAERRAHDVGTCIAAILSALCSAKVDMSGCQLAYLPQVDAINVRMDSIPDILVHAGGADPAAIANVVTEQLRSRGYIQDDGTVFVDMDQILGRTTN